MKKLFSAFVAMTFAVSLTAVAMAETKAKSAGKAMAAASAKSAESMKHAVSAKKKVARKGPKSHQITGIVTAIDADAGTLTVQGRKGTVDLKAGAKVKLGAVKEGDKVLVKYTGDTALSVKRVAVKK
ncbi:MAG: hypothetical protein HKM86_02715 [Deltaproteobacteria bacterium]|nr:hypothetical protein [Deltaproteobacteria bacterium]